MNEDLKWLAENVHEWEQGAHYLVKTLDGGCNLVVGEMKSRDNAANYYTRAQWKAARDELSGKPSWDDAPDWAESLAQWKSGSWEWFDVGIGHMHIGPVSNWLGYEKRATAGNGRVLGDWRDTLEQRPDNHSNETTEKVWRGPEDGLPPVGDDIEVWYDDGKECWKRAVVIGYHPESKRVIAVNVNTEGHNWKLIWSNQFRPIRSEEDKAVEEMMRIWVSTTGTDGQRMQALYRAGYCKQEAE